MNCKGKNVLYIGGFGGIGQKCCEEFLKNHIQNLVICDLNVNQPHLNHLQTTYAGTKVYFLPIDLTSKESIEKTFKNANDMMGHLDIVVNGGGILNECLVEQTIAVNLTGVIHSCLIALGLMNKSKGGQGGIIVNISSLAALEPSPMCSVYTATKFGVNGFTRAMADPLYYAETGVIFTAICPGLTSTPIINELHKKVTLPVFSEIIEKQLDTFKAQTPEDMAKILIEILEQATNGSVWLVDNGKYQRIQFSALWETKH